MHLPLAYYIDFEADWAGHFGGLSADEDGLPFEVGQTPLDRFWNPVALCQMGLASFNTFSAGGNRSHRQLALRCAAKLAVQAESREPGEVVWCYYTSVGTYRLRQPWVSAMAQGQAMSLLLRAHRASAVEGYAAMAAAALGPFRRTVEQGGVGSRFPDGSVTFEEFPTDRPSCALNGLIFALFGLYDMMTALGSREAAELFSAGVRALGRNLWRYDTGFWSRYDLCSPLRLSSRFYHRLHIRQLRALWLLTDRPTFLRVAERWAQYLDSPMAVGMWAVAKVAEHLNFAAGRKSVE